MASRSAEPDLSELTSAVQRVRETYAQPVNSIVARIRERLPTAAGNGAGRPRVPATEPDSSDCRQ